jgi:hypothetical protein
MKRPVKKFHPCGGNWIVKHLQRLTGSKHSGHADVFRIQIQADFLGSRAKALASLKKVDDHPLYLIQYYGNTFYIPASGGLPHRKPFQLPAGTA